MRSDISSITAQLICVFVWANANGRFSHEVAHFITETTYV